MSFQLNNDRGKKLPGVVCDCTLPQIGIRDEKYKKLHVTGNGVTHLVSCKVFAGMVILYKEKKILLNKRDLSFKQQIYNTKVCKKYHGGRASRWPTVLEASRVLSSPSSLLRLF